jgi:hypothetical protein
MGIYVFSNSNLKKFRGFLGNFFAECCFRHHRVRCFEALEIQVEVRIHSTSDFLTTSGNIPVSPVAAEAHIFIRFIASPAIFINSPQF